MPPSPKKSPVPKIATTASLPLSFTTVSFTLPFWTYMTLSAGSPCEKMACFFPNSSTLLDTPAESRKTCTSKALFFLGFKPDRGTLPNTVLVAMRSPRNSEGQTNHHSLAFGKERNCLKRHTSSFGGGAANLQTGPTSVLCAACSV